MHPPIIEPGLLDDQVDRLRRAPCLFQRGFVPIIIAAQAEHPLGVLVIERRVHPMHARIEIINETRGGVRLRFAGHERIGLRRHFAIDHAGIFRERKVGDS